MALPPDEKEAKRHWQAQEPSLSRLYNSKDKGLTQVSGPGEIAEIVTRELDEGPVAVYRQKTASNLPDPVARSQWLIRKFTQEKVLADEFLPFCECAEDMVIYHARYGNMKDFPRGVLFQKYATSLFDKQKEVLKQNNIDRARDDRKTRNTLENQAKLQKLLDAGALDVTIVEDTKGGD
jgi:hypothetical protein